MDYEQFLKDSGILENLNEVSVRDYFHNLTHKYSSNELSKEDYSQIVGLLLYNNVFLKSVEIRDLELLNLMEKAADLDFDDSGFEEQVHKYFSTKS